jgi:pyruvate dehydrogenase E2 component (dihydrolipoamide acetyltransferase)
VANQFRLPDVGEGLTEAEIVTWHVAEGDTVILNQMLVEVETAKALVELPSPYAGRVSQIHHNVGDTVAVGAVIISFGDSSEPMPAQTHTTELAPGAVVAGSDPADVRPAGCATDADPTANAEPTTRQPVLVGYGTRDTAVARRARRVRVPAPMLGHRGARPLATPPVRKFARNLSVDLNTVIPTGRRGQITREDIRGAASSQSPPQAESRAEVRIPIRGVRRHVAEAMVRSAFTAPHVTEWLTIDITPTLKLMDGLRTAPGTRDLRITPMALVARATILALTRHREINASWDDDAAEIVQHTDINLGIAVASPRGLIVPNIPAAQHLDFAELCRRLSDLVSDARANKVSLNAMRGGTFTITNVGVFGVDGATPILNPGESAILALGQIRSMPWNHKGRIRLRDVTTLSLSFDHRLVDGELGSRLLADIGALLEHPQLALAR